MAMNKVSIGFHGGGGISVRIEDESLTQLATALKAGDSWVTLETADGNVTLKAGEVVYISTDSGDHKVGFRGLGG
jgi:hypothetical protein